MTVWESRRKRCYNLHFRRQIHRYILAVIYRRYGANQIRKSREVKMQRVLWSLWIPRQVAGWQEHECRLRSRVYSLPSCCTLHVPNSADERLSLQQGWANERKHNAQVREQGAYEALEDRAPNMRRSMELVRWWVPRTIDCLDKLPLSRDTVEVTQGRDLNLFGLEFGCFHTAQVDASKYATFSTYMFKQDLEHLVQRCLAGRVVVERGILSNQHQ
jgi:hypothetical protein